ncbi:STE24 endopeptidase [Parasphingorhabdus marina DSM 22363]|uniref:STE24 endopeptidase n=1 Tax=Parasphingorhabdus marina DSM 22363 TaxID=1123272 RepID=A0A1N6CLR7_9SPHN|nr:M48 family metallopeptidase [Parasphingorhabdus marina]SIN59491.1 STE24 endopeptidase [Parasphingorhabdus marina DSM 22363]
MTVDPAVQAARMIDALGPESLEKAANYTVGSHWLLLWGLVVSALVTWLVVRWGILDKIWARLDKRSWAFRTFTVSAAFAIISSILFLPWTIYTDWWRESAYERTSQPIGDFLSQGAMGTVISAFVMGLFFLGVYALIRKSGKRWWLWSGGLAAFAITVMLLISPILIEPLFNEFKPVPEGEVRTAIEAMADEADIPHDRIFMYDGSRQSNNFTANVSGVFGSARIAISDVALKEASLDEVRAVTGHEIGHYVLNHIWRSVAVLSVLAIILFFLADRLFPWFARKFGSSASIGDPIGLPILVFVVGLLGGMAQPLTNGLTRIGEREADNYSLQTVNLPDALAGALIKTAEYRYPRPSAVQEMLFYTHPSVEWRVRNAMEWKASQGLQDSR